jgi:hypothetical protein
VITWAIMFPTNSDKPANVTISLVLSTVLLSSIVWTSEKFILQFFRSQFHQRAYFDRIEKIDKISDVLERLSKGLRKRAAKEDKKKEAAKLNEMRVNEATGLGIKKSQSLEEVVIGGSTPTLNSPRRSPNALFAQKAKDIGTGIYEISKATFGLDLNSTGGGIRHFGDPYKLAKKLFLGLRKGQASTLYMKDFEPFFVDIIERVEAFKIFDGDENGIQSSFNR